MEVSRPASQEHEAQPTQERPCFQVLTSTHVTRQVHLHIHNNNFLKDVWVAEEFQNHLNILMKPCLKIKSVGKGVGLGKQFNRAHCTRPKGVFVEAVLVFRDRD